MNLTLDIETIPGNIPDSLRDKFFADIEEKPISAPANYKEERKKEKRTPVEQQVERRKKGRKEEG